MNDAAGNTRWQDAVEKEVAALIMHKCFDFKTPDYKPPTDYKFCRLHLVYDIKNDLTYKARLVCNGSQVDPRGLLMSFQFLGTSKPCLKVLLPFGGIGMGFSACARRVL